MISSLNTKIGIWIGNELPQVKLPEPITAHIDELLGQEIQRQDWIVTACSAYLELVKLTGSIASQYMASLVIPLTCTEAIDIKGPTQDILEQYLDWYESPSLYLVDRDVFKYHEKEEKFLRPFDFDVFDIADNIYTEYITLRGKVGIDNNWEYTRFIQSSYFPDNHVLL